MAKGYSASSDVLTRTRDGQDLNAIWAQYNEGLAAFNQQRTPLVDLLSFTVTQVIEDIVQPGQVKFEKASEFGIPVSIRPIPVVTQRAFPFDWYDMRNGFTFQFLAGNGNTEGASQAQLDAVMNQVMEADNQLMFELVMKALFNNANRTTNVLNTAYTVTALYNADGAYIPPYNGVTFAGSHQHYIASGAATLDSTDLDQLVTLVTEHGYDRANGYTSLILVNKTEADVIKTFRRGVVNNNSQTAVYDFIPAQGTGFLLPVGWEVAAGGQQPGNTFANMNVIGAYGPYLIIEHGNIPAGYMVASASAGRATNLNVIGIREMVEQSLRGVVLRPGNSQAYPLIDSFFIRGAGTGVARRGGAAVMKITAGAYDVPTAFVW